MLLALNKSGDYILIDLYTQLSGESFRLVDNFRNIGFEIGPDAILRPLQDGTYLGSIISVVGKSTVEIMEPFLV